jgi:hypothetical protein
MSTRPSQEEWYKLAYDAWDEGTHDLTLEEEAALLRVCNQIYRRKGPIPNSRKLLCSLWRCHPNRADRLLDALLSKKKIILNEDGDLTNYRATTELVTRREVAERRASSGRLGGRHRSDPEKKTNENNDDKKRLVNIGKAEESRKEKIASPKEGEGAKAPPLFEEPRQAVEPADARVYRRGREILGAKSGGVITNLIKSKRGVLGEAMAILEKAADRGVGAMEFVQGAIRWEENRHRPTHGGDGVVWRDNLV